MGTNAMNRLLLLTVGLAWFAVDLSLAQQDDFPPFGRIVGWTVLRDTDGDGFADQTIVVYDATLPGSTRADIRTFQHHELDFVTVSIQIEDGTWLETLLDLNAQDPGDEPPDTPDYEDVFMRAEGFGALGPPDAPPLLQFPINTFAAVPLINRPFLIEGISFSVTETAIWGEFEGPIQPSTNFTYGSPPPPFATAFFSFLVPEILGRNQERLAGNIDFDTGYFIQFTFSNEEDPPAPEEEVEGVFTGAVNEAFIAFADPNAFIFTPCENCTYQGAIMKVIKSPLLEPPNPRPFADAAVSAQIVEAGTTVILDGTGTFDSSNVGFAVDSPHIFEKDTLSFTWEWVSGPARVDPVQDSPRDSTAEVVLTALGTYRYRLLVDDTGSAGLPTFASVEVTVVADLPENQPPVATINGPMGPVAVGDAISLDASASFDPDGDPLSFRWRQVNALGDPLPLEEVRASFQPLSGVQTELVTWQALEAGTFYFRLLADDGKAVSTATFTVDVVQPQTAGAVDTDPDADDQGDDELAGQDDDGDPSATPAPLCGAGLLPLLAAPLALLLIRRRS